MQHTVSTQPKAHNEKVCHAPFLTVLVLIALWSFMVWSSSVQANIRVTVNSTESPELFAHLKVLSEGGSRAQKLAFIQISVLRRLFLEPAHNVSKKTILESQLRTAIRDKLLMLPLLQPHDIQSSMQSGKLNVVVEWLPERLTLQVSARLQMLDKELTKYLRISSKSNHFEQLKRLMPALYNIEERRILLQLLKLNGVEPPPLKNSRLVVFLDQHISRLATGLTFNMKALVREGREFESDLITSLEQYSLIFTAKPADFILDYQLDSEGQNDVSGAWLFDARIALLAKFNIKIVSAKLTLSEMADNESQAQRQALAKMADSLSENLRAFLLEKH